MPCVSPNYACFTQAQLDSITTSNTCLTLTDSTGSSIQYGTTTHFARVDTRPTPSCGYLDLNATPAYVTNQYMSDAQAQAAYDAVYEKCNSQGLLPQ